MDLSLAAEILASTIRLSVPLILACLAGLWSERSGIVDIGLEGKMLAAAFAAASAAAYFQNVWLALLIAICVSLAFSLVHGYAAINQRGNQVVSGVAINMLAAGLAVVLGNRWFREGGRTPALPETARFMPIDFPGVASIRDIPLLNFFAKVFLGHSILTYVAFAMVPLTAWALARTRFGLRLRAVGENPHAVDTAGISVAALRYRAIIIAGILCGLPVGQLCARHDCRPRLHGAGRPHLCQLAGLARALCLPAVRFPPGGRHLPAGQEIHRRGNPGAVHQHAALCHDRHPACRFHREINSAQGQRHSLHQGQVT
jgi:ABC-type uncharacterized transport system permease subunit